MNVKILREGGKYIAWMNEQFLGQVTESQAEQLLHLARMGGGDLEIAIYTLEGELLITDLSEVGPCYPDDDVIYFNGVPCRLSSAGSAFDLADE